jgi:WD40 repeat protein/Tfp pilus assembly protein PilF/tRNA A-37 threonylcarbamoyl transferase component Bud32
MIPCPERETLVQFLDDRLPDPEREAVEAHVENCRICAGVMKRLTDASQAGLPFPPVFLAASPAGEATGPGEQPRKHAASDESGLQRGQLATQGTILTPEPTESFPAAHERFGAYELLDELGRGGMGVVHKARDRRTGRLVALKVILAGQLASVAEVHRFQAEASMVAGLDHPAIVPVYEVGESDGQSWFAMKLVEEATLTDWLARLRDEDALALRSGIRLLVQVCRGVHHANERGVLHRDLKPSNILLDAAGNPFVTDFGVARRLNQAGLTQTGVVVGTPSYMAPEQARGEKGLTTAVDVYALGAILFEMLTGRPPFRADTPVETLLQVIHDDPPRPGSLARVDRDLEVICLKCLDKDPTARYASAALLADDLERWLRGDSILGRRATLRERTVRWVRRHPAWTALAAVMLLTSLTVTGGSLSYNAELSRKIDQVEQANARRTLVAARERAGVGRFSHRVGQRYEGLEAVRQAVEIAERNNLLSDERGELRNIAIGCLALPDLRPVRSFGKWLPEDRFMAISPSLGLYALTLSDETIRVCRTSDDEELFRVRCEFGSQKNIYPWFSPGGAFLAGYTENSDRLKIWRIDSGRPTLVLNEEAAPGFRRGWDFTPDGKRVIFASGRKGELTAFDLRTGERQELPHCGVAPSRLRPSADGRLALVLQRNGKSVLEVREVNGSVPTHTLDILEPIPNCIRWSPDGLSLAWSGTDSRVWLWHLNRPRPLVLQGRHSIDAVLEFHPSGELLASADWSNRLHFWDVRTGNLLFSCEAKRPIAFSADGHRLVTGGTVWELAPGREYRTLMSDPGEETPRRYHQPSISPDGRLLAVGMEDGPRLWDLGRGRELLRLGGAGSTYQATFCADGSMLTWSWQGLFRWSVRGTGETGIRLGPPEPIRSREGLGFRRGWDRQFSASHDGQVIALARGNAGTRVLHRRTGRYVDLGPQPDVRRVATSPDGRYVAASSAVDRPGGCVSIWDAASGQHLHTLPVPAGAVLGFSPDGRWLVTGKDGYRIWHTGTWEPGASIEGGKPGLTGAIAFAPDSRTLALAYNYVIYLVDPATGKEYARLEDPQFATPAGMTFSPDGSQLVVTSNTTSSIHVWDLRLIRQQLAELKLDWQEPPRPAESPAPAPVEKVSVTPGLLGDPGQDQALYTAALLLQPLNPDAWYLRARASFRLKQWDNALADLERCLALSPGHAEGHHLAGQVLRSRRRREQALAHLDQAVAARPESSELRVSRFWVAFELRRHESAVLDLEKLVELCPDELWIKNGLAWLLATGPRHLRNLPRARQLAEQVVGRWPDEVNYLNTLGVVYYRLGEYERALTTLSASLAKRRGRDEAFDLYFLAMAHQRLGQTEQARAALDKAVPWHSKPETPLETNNQAELAAFRDEALTVVSATTASSVAAGSSAAGPVDGDRFGADGTACWRGRAGDTTWWWQIRFARPRQVGAILQVVGDHPTIFRNAPRRYVWQASPDGKSWEDLAETATQAERRMVRIHRLKTARTVQYLRLQVSAAEGDFPTLREVEFYSDPKRVIDFPDRAVLLDTTGKRRLPGEGGPFLRLAQRCKGWEQLASQGR